MSIDKKKLQSLLWSEVAAWKADCAEWKRNTEALQEFLGEKTVEEVALELLAENEALRDGANFRAIQSLRQDCDKLRTALVEIGSEIDGNTRPLIRDLVNRASGLNNGTHPNDLYGDCDRIEAIIDAAVSKAVQP